MKTKKQMIEEGYPEEVISECIYCKSWDCIVYPDCIVCLTCKKKRMKKAGGNLK